MNSLRYQQNALLYNHKGVALVIVLGAVAMISMLVVAFLTTARTEQRSASAFSDTVDARNLSEIPINLTIAQIRRATEQLGQTKTWASQPGLLRVYGIQPDEEINKVRSTTIALHKLYSDERMVVTKSNATDTANGMLASEVLTALNTDVAELAEWQNKKGMFVDMNEPSPVVTADSDRMSIQFPICDPRVAIARENGKPVDGFNFSGNTGLVNNTGVLPGTVKPTSIDDLNTRLPMPVKWLYLLADGRLVAPTNVSGSGELQFPGADGPSASNPITGRIAFWTDDESTKVNVNTASESRTWDSPRTKSDTEYLMAQRQPAQNEFSRYPGHPAQTCLSPIFQMFGPSWVVNHDTPDAERAAVMERYMKLNPRVPWGGSKGGTMQPTQAIALVDEQGRPKDGRLYANLDELVFTRDRQPQDPPLTYDDIAKTKFFLTTHSRAPELNLYNKTRLLLWPISANAAERNVKDKLLAKLGTTGAGPFYFVRAKNSVGATPGTSQDPHAEFTSDLAESKVTGFPTRNFDMYSGMLVSLTNLKVPGFGASFADNAKWGGQRRQQIMTEVVDFMRWSVNSYSSALEPKYYYLPTRTNNNHGESSAVPVIITKNKTRGFGRWPTITEASIVFVASEADKPGDKAKKLQAYLILEPFSPTVGPPSWSPCVRYRITGLEKFQVNGQPMQFPNKATLKANVATGYVGSGHSTAFNGIAQLFKKADIGKTAVEKKGDGARTLAPDGEAGHEASEFPFHSAVIDVSSSTDGTFKFSGSTITIEILTGFGDEADAKRIQTLQLDFTGGTSEVRLPIPELTEGDYPKLETRFKETGGEYANKLIQKGDTTRSVEIDVNGPCKGDLRLVSLMDKVTTDWFTTHPSFANPTVERLHFLRNGAYTHQGQFSAGDSNIEIGKAHGGRANTDYTGGSLIKTLKYGRDSPPAVPRGLDGALNADGRPGDFDNGTGIIEDGPYINKADESNAATTDGGYFDRGSFNVEGGATFSPNRQIASGIAFGSLSTGVTQSDQASSSTAFRPWQTLLFCPNPPSRSTPADEEPTALDHEGFKLPRDHLLLDLFWMPVVEPYAISENFATAGKINMNYQMMPFRHIERSTGIYSATKPISILAISPNSVKANGKDDKDHKGGDNYKEGTRHKYEVRYLVDTEKTLKGFTNRFDKGDVFRSASEICEIFLFPKRGSMSNLPYNSDAKSPPESYAQLTNWWNGSLNQPDAFEPTGDNSREAPYNQLYPRLTTQSNSYTVHYRVQMLKKARSTAANTWVEGKDGVLSEYRGSATLERFMDPNDNEIKLVMQGHGSTGTFDKFYRMRVIERKQFAP